MTDSYVYELAIIGAGPSGITAGVYAARKRMDFVMISSDIGGQTSYSSGIENYTGYQFISGVELAEKFEEHISQYSVNLKNNETVLNIEKQGLIFKIKSDKSEYFSKTVIIASGKKSRELSVKGESEFKNKGLFYCATCDGPLFSGKDVAVIGGGNSALDAAIQLLKIAKHVYIINSSDKLTGDLIMQENIIKNEKIQILNNTKVSEILGEKFVLGIIVESSGVKKNIPVEGIFVEIGLIPNSTMMKDLLKNNLDEIIIDCANRTNIEGVFAAGDVTSVPEKQIIIAAGEGAKAVLSAFRYLNTKRF